MPTLVTAGYQVRRRFRRSAGEVREVRRWTARALGRVPTSTAELAMQCVSELATNAVEHGRGDEIRVELAVTRDACVRVEVIDQGSTGAPVMRREALSDLDSESGRGLALVAVMASELGTALRDDGRHVWCAIDWAPEPDPPSPGEAR